MNIKLLLRGKIDRRNKYSTNCDCLWGSQPKQKLSLLGQLPENDFSFLKSYV